MELKSECTFDIKNLGKDKVCTSDRRYNSPSTRVGWIVRQHEGVVLCRSGVEIPAYAGCVEGRRMATVPKCQFDLEVCGFCSCATTVAINFLVPQVTSITGWGPKFA